MRIVVNAGKLAEELRLLNQVVAPKPPLPILSNVLMHASMEGLRLVTSDLELTFITTCPATIEEAGIVTIPVKPLLDLIDRLSENEVKIFTEKSRVQIQSGSFRGRLQALPPDDFPEVPQVSGEAHALPTAKMQTMVNRTRYAVSESGKYVVNGSLFTLTETVAALVSTDGRRLALTTTGRAGASVAPVVIPLKALMALTKMFTTPELSFSFGERYLFFYTDDRILASRLLTGQFPKYERVIPKDHDKKATIDRTAFTAAIKRVGLISEDDQKCYFSFSTDGLDIYSASAQLGEAAERLPIRYEGAGPVKVCCNWQFVLEFLEAAIGQTISVTMKDDKSPLLLEDGSDFINVVMLMKG